VAVCYNGTDYSVALYVARTVVFRLFLINEKDCFVASLLAMTVVLPPHRARNDGSSTATSCYRHCEESRFLRDDEAIRCENHN